VRCGIVALEIGGRGDECLPNLRRPDSTVERSCSDSPKATLTSRSAGSRCAEIRAAVTRKRDETDDLPGTRRGATGGGRARRLPCRPR